MRELFLAMPCHGGSVTLPTFLSVVQAMAETTAIGAELEVHAVGGDADLARCRNVLLGQFLQGDCDELLFVDADISWEAGAFTRFLRHKVDFVCGIYRTRIDAEIYPVHWPQQKRLWTDESTGLPLIEADLVPGGFWRLSRAGVEALAATVPDDHWTSDKLFPGLKYPWIFDFAFDGLLRLSEDFTFCRKWQAAVGPIWVDPVIRLGHTGPKTFPGDLLAQLQRETNAATAAMTPLERARVLVERA